MNAKLVRTGEILRDKESGKEMIVYKDGLGKGVSMAQCMGVTSGQRLIYLKQLKMEFFELIKK